MFSADRVREASLDVQRDIMEEWFEANFENPANETPYSEGEYWFIHGGPYEAGDVLWEEFGDIVSEEIINDLAEELIGEWAPVSGGNFYDQGFSDYPYANFDEQIGNIKKLMPTEIRNTHENVNYLFYGLLYAGVISALEVYLSDTFRGLLSDNRDLVRRFVEMTPKFKEQKIVMSDVYKTMDGIDNSVNIYLDGFVWHRLDKAEKMYERTLGIKFPEDMTAFISRAIQIRHAILHRQGKSQYVKLGDVRELVDKVEEFVSAIQGKIFEKQEKMEGKS